MFTIDTLDPSGVWVKTDLLFDTIDEMYDYAETLGDPAMWRMREIEED